MNFYFKFIVIFILSIVFLDLFFGLFFTKDIKNFDKYKVKVSKKADISLATRKDLAIYVGLRNINGFPYWEEPYKGPTLNYKKNKEKECRVLGIGGSIIRGSGVEENQSYFHLLSNKYSNSEFINLAIPGSMPIQQMIRLNKEGLLHDTNLLFWEIWHDDFTYFTFSNGILYNSKVLLDKNGNVNIFDFVPEKLNRFLIDYSYIYNKLLKIKMKTQIYTEKEDVTEDFIMGKVKKQVDDYLNISKENKVIFIFSPYLGLKPGELEWHNYMQKYMLDKFKKYFGDKNRVILLDEKKLLNIEDFTKYNLDNVHLNVEGNEFVSNRLYNYFKENNILEEKCY